LIKNLSKESFDKRSFFWSKIKIFAFSNADLRAIFRNCLNSFLDDEPEPSAILLDIDIAAPLNCSANLYNFFSSRVLATSNS